MALPHLENNMQKGFSTLFIVIILGSVSLALVLTLSTSTGWSLRGGTDDRSSAQARALVNGCAEVLLETIRENPSSSGSGTMNIAGNTCTYSYSASGGTGTINASGQVKGIIRKLSVSTTGQNPLTIVSWQEVP
jgi:hypothetical protein